MLSDSHLMDEITPPGSFLNPPLTPPPTEQKELSRSAQAVLDCLKLHRAGQRPPQSWWQRRLIPDDYREVLRVLDGDESLRGYVEDKIRLDYDPCRSLLTIRMPTPLHDIFCARVTSEILAQLGKFQKIDKAFGNFARKVDHKSTTRVWLPIDTENGEGIRFERSPDASFKHEQAKYPGVIIEVCYTQKVRAAADLADDYILDTSGNIKVVIALNIEYRGSKKATISIWRPEDITVDGVEELRAIAKVEELPFRTESGLPAEEPAEGLAFRLSLRDFAPTSISQRYTDLDQYISISSKKLFEFLSYAEAEQQQEMLDEGIVDPFPPGKRKRRRLRTPPEHPSSEEELTETIKAIKRGRLARDPSGQIIRGPESRAALDF